jgi:hypothetical protein
LKLVGLGCWDSQLMTEPYQDTADNRAELIAFLETSFNEAKGRQGLWAERMAHWWDLNPYANLDARRGWIMRESDGGPLIGFLGLIPTCYAIDGAPRVAMLPTTWVVDSKHQKKAFGIARRLTRMGKELLVVSTTGREAFQEAMKRRGWIHQDQARRRFLPSGLLGLAWVPKREPLAWGRRLITSTQDMAAMARPYRSGKGIEKWITTEYLHWYVNSPGSEQRFFGVVDEAGQLSSYVILAPKRTWGVVPTWSVVDWFTTESSNHEVVSILAALLAAPAKAGLGRCWLLRLTEMEGDKIWAGVRGILPAAVRLNHLYLAPAQVRDRSKTWVLAEGDLGL